VRRGPVGRAVDAAARERGLERPPEDLAWLGPPLSAPRFVTAVVIYSVAAIAVGMTASVLDSVSSVGLALLGAGWLVVAAHLAFGPKTALWRTMDVLGRPLLSFGFCVPLRLLAVATLMALGLTASAILEPA
jgi:hypothetical protein